MDQRTGRIAQIQCAIVRAAALVALLGVTGAVGIARAADKPVDFKKDIQPIFKQSCIKCHSLNNPRHQPAGDFRLDNKAEALKGGENGHDIVPGDAKGSLLVKLLEGPVKDGDQEIAAMPKARRGEKWKALPAAKVELVKRWIEEGAKWPE